MPMGEFYAEVRAVHVAAVYASGSLFALRGLASFAGMRGALTGIPRYSSWVIDTTLLAAALLLTTMAQQYPLVHHWLSVKVALLVVYVALGYVALRGAVPLRTRVLCYLGALGVFGFIISVARAHHPLGLLAP